MTDSSPEPQRTFTVTAGVYWEMPALAAAWRAGFWLGERPFEQNASRGQRVNLRRLEMFGTVAAHPVGPERIDGHEKKIGVRSEGRRKSANRAQR